MSIDYNRIKVSDLETNQPNKILATNSNGELEFSDNIKIDSYNALDYTSEGKVLDARQGKILKDLIDNSSPSMIPVSNTNPGIVNNVSLQELGGVDKIINLVRIGRGASTTSPTNSTALGYAVLDVNITGVNNTALGSYSLSLNTSGSDNTGVGLASLYKNTTGGFNTAIGAYTLSNNLTGVANTALGYAALNATISGNNNVGLGLGALRANIYGSDNVAVGTNALNKNVGTSGSSIYGFKSIAIGNYALYENTIGHGIAIGYSALRNNSTGTWNIALGTQAGNAITTGTGNVIVADTGFVALGGGITTGSNNMILAPNNGNTTGITTGSGNVVIGKVTGLAVGASNTITLADGAGNITLTKSTIGELQVPNLTSSLIISGGSTSLVNKGYIDNIGAVDNATTTNLSSSILNSTYPNAMNGFRVHCMSISGGALTYEKTASSWIQYSIVTVTT